MQPAASTHENGGSGGKTCRGDQPHTKLKAAQRPRAIPEATQSAAQDGSGATAPKRYRTPCRDQRQRRGRPAAADPDRGNRRRTCHEQPRQGGQDQKPPTEESAGDQPNKGSNPNHLPRQSGQQPPARTTCQEISNSGASTSTAAQRRGRLSQPEEPATRSDKAEDDKPARRDQRGSTQSPSAEAARPRRAAGQRATPAEQPQQQGRRTPAAGAAAGNLPAEARAEQQAESCIILSEYYKAY